MSLLDEEHILIDNTPIKSMYDIWGGSLSLRSLKKFCKLKEFYYENKRKFTNIYNEIWENNGLKYCTYYWQVCPSLKAFICTIYDHNGPINDLIDILQPYMEYDADGYKYELIIKTYKNGNVRFFLKKENDNTKKSILILKPKKL